MKSTNRSYSEKPNQEINSKRNYLVVKSNDLIQKTRFNLSLTEQKAVAYICSMIKPADDSKEYQLEYEFDVREYCKCSGIDFDNGGNYKEIKSTLENLRNKSWWLTQGNVEILVGWLSKAKIEKNTGTVIIKIDEDLAPYLFNVKQKFTQYYLYNILAMKSAFSVRIYEILCSYLYQKKVKFNLDELKKILMVDDVKSYKNFSDFRRFVLEIAMREINELTNMEVSYIPIKKGRKVVEVEFIMKKKDSIKSAIKGAYIDEKLDSGLYKKKKEEING